jgi:hypothetical protein
MSRAAIVGCTSLKKSIPLPGCGTDIFCHQSRLCGHRPDREIMSPLLSITDRRFGDPWDSAFEPALNLF